MIRRIATTLALVAIAPVASATQEKLKVIVDQDARGPCTTDIQAILVLVQSPDVEVLGITVVSGDLWMEQETRHTLRALEIAGRTDIPVYRGAVFPLVHTQAEAKRWETLYGKQSYQGAWQFEPGPYDVQPLAEGEPTTEPAEGHAANFMVERERASGYSRTSTTWSATSPRKSSRRALRSSRRSKARTKATMPRPPSSFP